MSNVEDATSRFESDAEIMIDIYHYLNSAGTKSVDIKRCKYWLHKAATEEKYPKAAILLGLMYYLDTHTYPDNKRLKSLMVKYLTQAAENGIPDGALLISEYYANLEEWATAAKWAKLGAENNIPMAAGRLASLYISGKGITTNYKQAKYWIDKGIKEEEDGRCYGLRGVLYENGWNYELNYEKALSDYSKGCQLGDDLSCILHRDLYQRLNK